MISGRVRGGFTVDIDLVRAFLPGSLVDVRPIRDPAALEGQTLEFKVIKLDQKRNNVVVSRRAVVEAEYSAERESLLKNLQEGTVLKGVVKNLTDYGAFVDLGGIDGLLHITDMAWKRVKHPSEVVSVGQELEVKVLKFDRERNRVSLGLKQLGADPWADLARRYPPNTRLFGKVTNIADYGCFAEIEEGVEGLVHVSEMDWTNKNVNPHKVVQIGDEVEVMVLDIDEERRRISLGLKQCKPNPWVEFGENYKKGDKVSGQIKSITDFGVFIGLPGGIDGLVHLSDLSWDVPGEEAVRNYKKGEELETTVLAIDPERERISLGVKQLDKDPLSLFLARASEGQHRHGRRSGARREDGDASRSMAASSASCVPRRSRAIASRMRARCSRSVRPSKRGSRASIARPASSRCRSRPRKSTKSSRRFRTTRATPAAPTTGTTLGDLLKEQMTPE